MKTLTDVSVFSEGASLWIIGDLEHSSWAEKLDWYLNFQLKRSLTHKSPQISKQLAQILDDAEMPVPKPQDYSKFPLMIASSRLLPNRKTVQVPWRPGEGEWVSECYRIWRQLGAPSLRIFLPKNLSVQSFERHWPKTRERDVIELVTES